jgi:ribonuclease E
MGMLMPTHVRNVKPYHEAVPLFQRHHIEAQLDAMFSPTVTLRSGGYIVINQTEALVSIDVNSGRATREHSIEETARKTNLEAAEEIGRQLRLRDLAGLIVIDFIDMEDGRNDRDVEKRLRDAVARDRARIQIGRISQFGLLEMSRQRLRAGVIAGSTVPCPHCGGQGIVRSVESTSLRVLRGLEEEAQKQRAEGLTVHVAPDVAIYTLNQKRRELARLEAEYSITINFEPKPELMAGEFEIARIGQRNPEDFPRPVMAAVSEPVMPEEELDIAEEEELDEEDEAIEAADSAVAEQDPLPERSEPVQREGGRRRRRRGGRNRGGRDRQNGAPREFAPPQDGAPAIEGGEALAAAPTDATPETTTHDDQGIRAEGAFAGPPGEAGPRRRRRRRRGRRGGNRDQFAPGAPHAGATTAAPDAPVTVEDRFGPVSDDIDTTPRDEPRVAPNASSSPSWTLQEPAEIDTTPKDEDKPAKKGWWQRAFRT